MISFILIAALLTLAVLSFLLYPLLAARTVVATTTVRLNATIYRDQQNELERDFADGVLSASDYANDRESLQRRLLEDTADTEKPVTYAKDKRTAFVLAALVPLAAAGLYAALGAPEAINPTVTQRNEHPAVAQNSDESGDLERMVAGLAAKQEKNPENLEGWLMLGRSYKAFGRFDEAIKALERAMPLIEKDAMLLAVYADTLAAQAGGHLEGKPRKMIEQALTLDPHSVMALDLAGVAAYERKDFGAAIEYWERLRKRLPPDSEQVKSLDRSLAEARSKK